MSLTNTAENNILNAMLGSGYDVTGFDDGAGNLWLGVSGADPGESGTGLDEPNTGAYARVQVVQNDTNWPAASGGQKSNGAAFSFVEATAQWLSGNPVTHWFLANSNTIGDTSSILLSGALTASKVVDTGDTLRFNASAIVITLD